MWLERTDSDKARAVKEVDKCIQIDHLKEIRAIAKFSKVWVLDVCPRRLQFEGSLVSRQRSVKTRPYSPAYHVPTS